MKIICNVAGVALLALTGNAAHACFKYDKPGVTVAGTLVVREYFVMPEYGDSPATDVKMQQAIVMLDKPICTDKSDLDREESDQMEVTLLTTARMSFSRYVGKHVTAKGTMLHATSRNHHTPLLLVLEARPVVQK